MKKLTADKCREMIHDINVKRDETGLSIREERYLEALEIALPVLEQKESGCQKCGGTGMADSGGTQPWGEQILIECDCVIEQQKKGNDGWIEWGGGSRPVKGDTVLETRWSDGDTVINRADAMTWEHDKYCNLIAYRVIENDGRGG